MHALALLPLLGAAALADRELMFCWHFGSQAVGGLPLFEASAADSTKDISDRYRNMGAIAVRLDNEDGPWDIQCMFPLNPDGSVPNVQNDVH